MNVVFSCNSSEEMEMGLSGAASEDATNIRHTTINLFIEAAGFSGSNNINFL